MQFSFHCRVVDLLQGARCAAAALWYMHISAHLALKFSVAGVAYFFWAHTGYYMLRMDTNRHLGIDELMNG